MNKTKTKLVPQIVKLETTLKLMKVLVKQTQNRTLNYPADWCCESALVLHSIPEVGMIFKLGKKPYL